MASRSTRSTAAKPASKEVVKAEALGDLLPDLTPTRRADFEVDSRDIVAPRIKAASPASTAVSAGLVPLYSLFSQQGQEDEDPKVLVEAVKSGKPDFEADPDYGLKVYVLKMYKNLSASVNPNDWNQEQRQDGELRTWRFGDPRAPQFAKVQYNYVVYVPEAEDSDMPHNLLLKSSSVGTARQINGDLLKLVQEDKPMYVAAYRIWPEKRERQSAGQTQRWAAIKARQVEPDLEEIKVASKLAAAVADREVETVTGEVVDDTLSGQAPAI